MAVAPSVKPLLPHPTSGIHTDGRTSTTTDANMPGRSPEGLIACISVSVNPPYPAVCVLSLGGGAAAYRAGSPATLPQNWSPQSKCHHSSTYAVKP